MRISLFRPALALAFLCAFPPLPLASQAPVQVLHDRDWAAFLGPFPPLGSQEGQEELAILLWLQHTRTPADVARAMGEVMLHPRLFSAAAGVDLESGRFPLTLALLQTVRSDLREVTAVLKNHFARPRPYGSDARIKPAVPLESNFSYPSGHSAWGVMESMVLAQLVPAHGEAILARGRLVGFDRVMGGVHYPSDVEAGQRLGEALAGVWLQDPARRQRVEEVRAAEWRGFSPTGK